jgi:hypothetical protein
MQVVRPLLGAAAVVLACPCAAQNAVTLYGGYRGGGSFQSDTAPSQTLRLSDSGAASISLDWAVDGSRQVQLFASYQPTEIGASPTTPVVPLNVSYLHLGGINYFDGPIGRGAYVVGGLGASRLSPGLSGLAAEYFPSMNLGLGYQWPLAAALSLRFELRGYLTLISNNTKLFCSGGCVVSIKGDALTQAEAMLGLSVAF